MKIIWEPVINEENGNWVSDESNYQRELDNIPIKEIERYLRKKKLERIKKCDEST